MCIMLIPQSKIGGNSRLWEEILSAKKEGGKKKIEREKRLQRRASVHVTMDHFH